MLQLDYTRGIIFTAPSITNIHMNISNLTTLYLMKIRFSEVGRLLRSTNMTVADIISELGVNDRTQFYKSFKDYFGMTPSEYREVVKIPK